jgi:hypothetical protein
MHETETGAAEGQSTVRRPHTRGTTGRKVIAARPSTCASDCAHLRDTERTCVSSEDPDPALPASGSYCDPHTYGENSKETTTQNWGAQMWMRLLRCANKTRLRNHTTNTVSELCLVPPLLVSSRPEKRPPNEE